jgi:hypothetical protein
MKRWCLVCVTEYEDNQPLGGCCPRCVAERKQRLVAKTETGGMSCIHDPDRRLILGTVEWRRILPFRTDVRWYKKQGSNGDG